MSQHKHDDIHWLTGQFRSASKEAQYRASIRKRVRQESGTALIVVAVIFAMFGINDYNMLSPAPEYYGLLVMRIVVVSSCLLLAFAIGRTGDYSTKAWMHALPLWGLATGIFFIVPMRPDSILTQITAVAVAVAAFFLLIPNLLTIAASASLYLSVGFLITAMAFVDLEAAGILSLTLLLIMANLVGYTGLLRMETLQRKQFALLHDERDQNRQLLNEIAHRKSLEAQLRNVAEKDALTGLDSRSHFMKRAEALLQRAKIENDGFSLFMMDVDHFKTINDTWGHTRGDKILVAIAEVCQTALRPGDIIGRFGGEEFVVGLPNTNAANAKTVAERMRHNVEALSQTEELNDLQLSITIGGAVSNAEDDLDTLITRADDKLYEGKRDGRNRVLISGETL